MALSITQQPPTYVLSGNPVIYKFTSPDSGVSNRKFHIIIYDSLLNVIGTDSCSGEQEQVTFDISVFLKRRFISHVNPATNTNAVNCDNIILEYNIRCYETYNNDGQEHNSVMIGGIAFEGKFDIDKLNIFEQEGKTFHSEFAEIRNPHLINRINPSGTKADLSYIYRFIQKRFHAERVITLSSYFQSIPPFIIEEPVNPDKKVFYAFPIGLGNLIIPVCHYIGINIADVISYNIILRARRNSSFPWKTYFEITQNIEKDYIRNEQTLFFKNQLGVFETVVFQGEYENDTKIKRNIQTSNTQRILLSEFERKRKISSKWLDEDQFNAIINLIKYSKDTFIFEDNRNKPIIVNNDKIQIKSNDFLKKIEIEFTYSEIDFI